jgi:aryl-alcohol dehydrogenase-like predicted oxidoreductase
LRHFNHLLPHPIFAAANAYDSEPSFMTGSMPGQRFPAIVEPVNAVERTAGTGSIVFTGMGGQMTRKAGLAINRRIFVGSAFAGMSMLGLDARAEKPVTGATPMREFGKTGVKLTIVGQAGARLALLRTKEAARAQVRHAYDLGLNYFDCAHSYWNGHSEEVYGDVLSPVRKDVFITTKCTIRTRKEAEAELNLSLAALKTDHVDLWQIHGVQDRDDVDRIFAPGGAIEAFESARQAGKCRFIGFTGHHDPDVHLEMLKRYGQWDSILMPLHAADPAYLSFKQNVLPHAVDRGIGIQAMKVFGNAFLLRVLSVEECLRYALSLPISCAAVGASTFGQLDDDVRIAQNLKPYTPEEMQTIEQLAVSAGPGGLYGPALEYWKVGGVWK